jgi:hypothetical protein
VNLKCPLAIGSGSGADVHDGTQKNYGSIQRIFVAATNAIKPIVATSEPDDAAAAA